MLSRLTLSNRICPIFQVSNVTGTGLDFVCVADQTFCQLCLTSRAFQVRTFLNLLPASEGDVERFDSTQPLEVPFTITNLPPPSSSYNSMDLKIVLSDGYLVGALCWHGRKRPAQLWHDPERRSGTLWPGLQRYLRTDYRQDHAAQTRRRHDSGGRANCCAGAQARAPCGGAQGDGDRASDGDTAARCAIAPSMIYADSGGTNLLLAVQR